MSEQDTAIEWLKERVGCGELLERLAPVWRLDRAQSSRRSLKYRRGADEILIVSHGGRGWWDPLSAPKGDIFTLVRHLDPGLNFGGVRRVLREFAGTAPASVAAPPTRDRCRHRMSPSVIAGSDAGGCRAVCPSGSISPDSGRCRQASSRLRTRPRWCAKAPTAAPGSRTATVPDA